MEDLTSTCAWCGKRVSEDVEVFGLGARARAGVDLRGVEGTIIPLSLGSLDFRAESGLRQDHLRDAVSPAAAAGHGVQARRGAAAPLAAEGAGASAEHSAAEKLGAATPYDAESMTESAPRL